MLLIPWREAAKVVGLSQHELYVGIVAKKYPSLKVGNGKGRYLVDVDLLRDRIQEIMTIGLQDVHAAEPAKIRRTGG